MKRRVTSVPRVFRVLILFTMLILISSASYSLEHVWSDIYGGFSNDFGQAITPTPDGGVMVTGYFQSTVDFGGGPLTSSDSSDIFVMKLDSAGNHVWSRRFGETGEDAGLCIAVTPEGAALITGYISGTVDFGGGPITGSSTTIFVLKLDSNGNHLWSQGLVDDSPNGWVKRIVATPAGEVMVTGAFNGTIDFGGGPITSAGEEDIFVLKLDSDGNHLWSQTFGDAESQWGRDISVTLDNEYLVSGAFYGTTDFGGGPVTSAAYSDIFVLKLDSDGNHLWSRTFGGALGESGNGISATSTGGALITGDFGETVDFGGGPLTSAGSADIFVAKLDSDGNHLWSRRYGDGDGDYGYNIMAAPDGSALVTGDFYDDVYFGGDVLTADGFLTDIFALKLDNDGNHVWSVNYGAGGMDQNWRGLALAPNGGALLTGSFWYTADFGGGPLTSAGSSDIFVLRLQDGEDVGVTDFPIGTTGWSFTAGPNPFRNSTTLRMTLPQDAFVQVSVYDVGGRLVKHILDGSVVVGQQTLLWDGTNSQGESVPTGVYMVRMESPEAVSTVRVVRLR